MNKLFASTLRAVLPLMVAIVFIYLFIYLIVQQNIRLMANEIPMQYALEAKAKLESGAKPEEVVAGLNPVDTKYSLFPFLIVLNANGSIKATTCNVNGKNVMPPIGILEPSKKTGQNSVTWQPRPDIRNAIVVLPYSINGYEGYVIGGRSLSEAEKRIRFAGFQITEAIIFTLLAAFLTSLIVQYRIWIKIRSYGRQRR